MSNLQTYCHFQLDFQKMDCKHDIKESKGNMFNPILKDNVQGQKHPGSYASLKIYCGLNIEIHCLHVYVC